MSERGREGEKKRENKGARKQESKRAREQERERESNRAMKRKREVRWEEDVRKRPTSHSPSKISCARHRTVRVACHHAENISGRHGLSRKQAKAGGEEVMNRQVVLSMRLKSVLGDAEARHVVQSHSTDPFGIEGRL